MSSLRRVARWLVAAVLVGAPLARGGAHPEVNFVLAAVLVMALGCVAWSRRNGHGELRIGVVALAAVLALVTALMQLVPLPAGLVAMLAPTTHALQHPSAGVVPAWATFSLDRPATAHEVAKLVAALVAALLAGELYGSRHRLRELSALLVGAGVVVVLVGVVRGLILPHGGGAAAGPVLVSTFVNPNHLACFLGFVSFAGLGGAWMIADARRWLLVLGSVVCGAGVFLTLSRGGILAYVATILFLGVLVPVVRRLSSRAVPSSRASWLPVALGLVVVVAGSVAYTQVVLELFTLGDAHGFNKATLWRPVPTMLRELWALGLGRGAFVTVYPGFAEVELPVTFTHLENEALQTLVDFGPLVGTVLLGLAAWALAQATRRALAEPSRLAFVAALVFVGLHNLMDFGLTLTGILVPATMLLTATGLGEETDGAGWKLSRGMVRTGVGVLALGLAVLGPLAIRHALVRDTARFSDALTASAPHELEANVSSFLSRHPADYVMPLMVAERLLHEPKGAAPALRWVNRAMVRSPRSVLAHRLAGRALQLLGRHEQAMIEYRLALNAQPQLAPGLAQVAHDLGASLDVVETLGQAGMGTDEALADWLLARGEAARALRVLSGRLIATSAVAALRARAYLALGRLDEARAAARWIREQAPESALGYELGLAIERTAGAKEAAWELIERGLGRVGRRESLLRMKVELLLADSRFTEARGVVQRLLERSLDARQSAEAHVWLGQIHERQGSPVLALREYQRAKDVEPRSAQHRMELARVRESMGDYMGARLELERAQHDLGAHEALEKALMRVRARAQTQAEALKTEKLLAE